MKVIEQNVERTIGHGLEKLVDDGEIYIQTPPTKTTTKKETVRIDIAWGIKMKKLVGPKNAAAIDAIVKKNLGKSATADITTNETVAISGTLKAYRAQPKWSRLSRRSVPRSSPPSSASATTRSRRCALPGRTARSAGRSTRGCAARSCRARAMGLGDFIWQRTTLDRRLIELAILVTGRAWRSNVEWVAHVRLRARARRRAATIDEIFAQRRPESAPEDERLVYDVAERCTRRATCRSTCTSAPSRASASRASIELLAVLGFYTFVSMTLNSFDVPMPGVSSAIPTVIPLGITA